MIELKPKTENSFTCPECQAPEPVINDILIPSVHVMADCTCRECGLEFYEVFPVGHAVEDHLCIGKFNGIIYKGNCQPWLVEALQKLHREHRKNEIPIKKTIYKTHENVVILNTLDFLYGHVLLKLYNALHHLDHHKDLGLVLIIPKMFEWLVPEGCAEVWVVDLKLNELAYGYESLQKFTSQEFKRFKKIYLSKAYSHPDCTSLDIGRLTRVKPFDLSKFDLMKPVITFVLREDRWWFRSVPDYWLYRICRKMKMMKFASRFLALRQNQLVKQTIRHIRNRLPEVDFYIVGLGRTGNFAGYAIDERHPTVDFAVESYWCKIYSRSHVVTGVHGSNMLLPTALAAGCVEILPQDRYGNMVQDISVKYSDRRQLFFCRFVDQYAAPQSVARKAVSIVNDYRMFEHNMCRNLYREDSSRNENSFVDRVGTKSGINLSLQ